jgi:transcriptional regulator with XRE-family HTH domain
MSETRTLAVVPSWRMADRIRRALDHADIGVSELADQLEINRNTVGNWLSGRSSPRGRDLRAVARVCGVDPAWLEHGSESGQLAKLRTEKLSPVMSSAA